MSNEPKRMLMTHPHDGHSDYDTCLDCGRTDGGCDRTVQGEPTDAQVLAALNAYGFHTHKRYGVAGQFDPAPDLLYYTEGRAAAMRAALRAALGSEEK